MFTRIAMTGLALALVVGCAKKAAKFTGKADDSAAATPQPVGKPKPADTGEKKDDKPNWLTDPRARTEGDQLPTENLPAKPGLGVKLPTPEPGGTLPQGGGAQPRNPMGVLQPQPAAPPSTPKFVGKPVTEADMKEVWIFMENASIVSGKLPPPPLVYAALVKAEAKAAELVKDSSIFLTGATARESIWAFELKALSQGGWVATQNGVENLTAAELKRRLGR
jgi:hypothetical protein